MPYSVEPLPKQPDQGKPASNQPPLVRLTIYVVGGVFVFTTLTPHGGQPDGLPAHKPHTETKEPSTRVDSARVVAYVSASSAVALPTSLGSFGPWRLTSGSA